MTRRSTWSMPLVRQPTLRVCGSFIEKDGVWKVFSYVVDDD